MRTRKRLTQTSLQLGVNSIGLALERMHLDGVTIINKESNRVYYPAYRINPSVRDELLRKDLEELQIYISSLPDKYDIFIDLHDYTSPNDANHRRWLKEQISPNFGKLMPEGYVAINEKAQPEFSFADVDIVSQFSLKNNRNIRLMEQNSRFPLEINFCEEHLFGLKPYTRLDVGLEFYFARFKRGRNLEFWQYTVQDGVSVVNDLISCLRSV